jgi:hypothetical protein
MSREVCEHNIKTGRPCPACTAKYRAQKPDDGGLIFPLVRSQDHYTGEINVEPCGLTVRDWFAGQALQSILVARPFGTRTDRTQIAKHAYEQADAMILARKG